MSVGRLFENELRRRGRSFRVNAGAGQYVVEIGGGRMLIGLEADFRAAVTPRVDRMLVDLTHNGRMIRWVTPSILEALGLSASEAEAAAFGNLARALR